MIKFLISFILLIGVVSSAIGFNSTSYEYVKYDFNSHAEPVVENEITLEEFKLTKALSTRYKTVFNCSNVIQPAIKFIMEHQNEVFPTSEDLASIISIESAWDKDAKSNLKTDPAMGLTQIRLEIWSHLIGDYDMSLIDNQIMFSSMILTMYYYELGEDKDKAILAYNQGIGTIIQTDYAMVDKKYLHKFDKVLEYINSTEI